ncbi:MAG: membrane dipeptidase, partial [Planctomycetaceae bacterium]|nr:membrane dipeptidase [Planctomycetaceae bacterium]
MSLIFDAHLDLSMNALEWNRDLRWSQERLRRWELSMSDKPDRSNNTVCFPEMRRGGIGICVATQIARNSGYFHKLPGWASPEQAWAQTQGQLAWYREMELQGELVQIRNRSQLDKHLELWKDGANEDDLRDVAVDSRTPRKKRPIGYILSLEGADSIVTLKHLERSYEDGLRALGPAHYGPGRYAHGTDATGPLTPIGRDLLKEMRRLGIILDVTHLCDETFWEALDLYDGPLWASHQNCRTLAPWNRQFADDQIKAVAERGGVLGMAFDAIMMTPG